MKILVDGTNAFIEIMECIKNSKNSILINMFIWRDDNIGNQIAQAILDAANRGVKVYISKDRYGLVLEKSEEVRKSFFHKKMTLSEKIKVIGLNVLYPMKNAPKKANDEITTLYSLIMNHSNITISCDIMKADHSKYYIFDDSIMILGGINVEDKENGKDMQGRIYNDYMIKLEGQEFISEFNNKICDLSLNSIFQMNYKKDELKHFEMKKNYLDIICNANEKLIITMAYFSPIKEFINEIVSCFNRGCNVSILIPENANYQDSSNKKTIKKIMKKTNNGINLFFSPKMVHTKLVMNENSLSFGSTNITKKAFNQLSELNIKLDTKNNETELLIYSIIDNQKLSKKIDNYKIIKYNKILAFLEGFLV